MGLDKYFGGSRDGTGHFWTAVDDHTGRGGIWRYDYGSAGYNGPGGGSLGPLSDAFSNLNAPGKVELTWYPDINAAARGNEYYQFQSAPADDQIAYGRMLNDYVNPPRYSDLEHNCGDASLAVAGFSNVGKGDVWPSSFLDDIRGYYDDLYPYKRLLDYINKNYNPNAQKHDHSTR